MIDRRPVLVIVAIAALGACYEWQAPSWAAGALLHPARRAPVAPRRPHEPVHYRGDGVVLKGWMFRAEGRRAGTLIYLHGVSDNRQSAVGIAGRLVPLGFDVVAYDSRAHGESGGEICTYGFYEKRDLSLVIAALPGPIAVVGQSLGAAVALQAAPLTPRLAAIVAAETFSDLRTVARERAPRLLLPHIVARALALAERRGGFHVDSVSPVGAAAQTTTPVLLVHGAADVETTADHSERVYAALRGEKRLILVRGAGHNQSLTSSVWSDVERWLVRQLTHGQAGAVRTSASGSPRPEG